MVGASLLALAHSGRPGKRAVKRLCVYVLLLLLLLLPINSHFPREPGSVNSPSGPRSLLPLPPVREENLWALMERGFYGADVLPATQPSVSKQPREHKALTISSGLASLLAAFRAAQRTSI